jgi:hypothetical protein
MRSNSWTVYLRPRFMLQDSDGRACELKLVRFRHRQTRKAINPMVLSDSVRALRHADFVVSGMPGRRTLLIR